MRSNLGTFISTVLIGMTFGAVLTLLLTPWAGGELREKVGLGHEDPQRKIERVRRAIKRLEEKIESRRG